MQKPKGIEAETEGKNELKERGCIQDERDFGCDECDSARRLLESLVKHIKNTQVRCRYKDCKVTSELAERMESHMKRKDKVLVGYKLNDSEE